MTTTRDLCRQHGSPYIRPSARRERLADLGALVLLVGALTLPSAFEREIDMQPNLNTPALEQGPLTADEADDAVYRRDVLMTLHRRRVMPPITGRDTCTGECETVVGCLCQTAGLSCNQGRACPVRAPQAAECCTEIGAEPKGKHRTGFLSTWWLRLKRALA